MSAGGDRPPLPRVLLPTDVAGAWEEAVDRTLPRGARFLEVHLQLTLDEHDAAELGACDAAAVRRALQRCLGSRRRHVRVGEVWLAQSVIWIQCQPPTHK
jgi:hypothetical protein